MDDLSPLLLIGVATAVATLIAVVALLSDQTSRRDRAIRLTATFFTGLSVWLVALNSPGSGWGLGLLAISFTGGAIVAISAWALRASLRRER